MTALSEPGTAVVARRVHQEQHESVPACRFAKIYVDDAGHDYTAKKTMEPSTICSVTVFIKA